MNFTPRFLLIVTLLVLTAHRLPAPIREVPDEQTRSKKSSAKAKPNPSEAEVAAKTTPRPASGQAAAKFAGSWAGTITQPMGTSKVSLVFNPTATAVTFSGRERRAVLNSEGSTITWHSGLMDGNVWTLTPNSDGKTAHVVLKGGMGGEWSATFNRERTAK